MATAKAIITYAKLLSSHSRRYSLNLGKSTSLWTTDNTVISPYKDVEIPNSIVPEHVWQDMEKWADKTAVVCAITNRNYTYHQLYKYTHNFGANLRTKLKVSDGDVVCIMMFNCPEYPLAALGVMQAGAELTTVNPIYTAYEVQRQLILSDPKVIIGSPDTVAVIKEALKLMKRDIPIINITINGEIPVGTISFQELAQDNYVDISVLKDVKIKSEDVAILPYSSGTTGLPKGVELTHKNIVVNCVQQDIDGVKLHHDTTSTHQESVLAVLPFYHIYGLSIVMAHKLAVGAKIVTVPKFQPNTFLSALKEQKISLLYAAPPIYLFLGSYPEAKKEHLDSVQKFMTGAAPLPQQEISNVLKKAKPGSDFLQLYGLTETSPLVTAAVSGTADYTSAGFAISNTELKIVDSDSNILGPNKIGELLIRGPQVMKGYRNNSEATNACITEDGWFRSGDLCTLRDNGTIIVTDRLKELIKVKGYQVAPAELENVLKEHPAILDAGVVGVPDQRTGEAPKAFVVLKEGHKENAANIIEFVKERVAEFKRVKEVMFLKSLPRNPSGKLLRRVLKDNHS